MILRAWVVWMRTRLLFRRADPEAMELFILSLLITWGTTLMIGDGDEDFGAPPLGAIAAHLPHRFWAAVMLVIGLSWLASLLANWRMARVVSGCASIFWWLFAAMQFWVTLPYAFRATSFTLLAIFALWAAWRAAVAPSPATFLPPRRSNFPMKGPGDGT